MRWPALLAASSLAIIGVVAVWILARTGGYVAIVTLKWPALAMGTVLATVALVFLVKASSDRSLPLSGRLMLLSFPGIGGLAFAAGLLCYGVLDHPGRGVQSLLSVALWIGRLSMLTAAAIAAMNLRRWARRDGDAA